MSFRFSVQTIVIFEIVFVTFLMSIGFLTKSSSEFYWSLSLTIFIHLVLFSTPLAFVKGFNFVIHDAPPDSPWKYCGFAVVFFAAFFGSMLDEYLSSFVLAL